MPKKKESLAKAIDLAAKRERKNVHKIKGDKKGDGMPDERNPTLYIHQKQYPEIESWDVDDTVHLAVEAKVTRRVKDARDEMQKNMAAVEITSISDITSRGGGKS